MNDCLFIIDQPPRPSTDDVNPDQDVKVIAKVADPGRAGDAHASLLAAAPDLLALAKAYEQWEADLILCCEAWDGGTAEYPRLTEKLYDRMLEIQAARNAAIAKATGKDSADV
jgi:hypothetical protein